MQTVAGVSISLYILSSITYFMGQYSKVMERVSLALVGLAWFCNLLILAMRTKILGRLPLVSGYDFLLIFTLIMVVMFIINSLKTSLKTAGGPVMMVASLSLLTAVFFMSNQSGDAVPLAPVLKSPWLTVHVLTAAMAYGGFALAAVLAIAQLKNIDSMEDDPVYRIVAFSFILLSLSIVLGAIWAEQAWGSYWSWDPKETWALITWITYATYLHLHQQRSWRGKPANFLVVAGFIIILFTFFGVSYFFSGMHSYS